MTMSLLTFEQAFYTGDFSSVVSSDIEKSDRVDQSQIRAYLALGQTEQALARIQAGNGDVHEAFKAFVSKNNDEAEDLAVKPELSDAAKHILALKFATQAKYSKALELLESTRENLDAGLLQVHILLSLDLDTQAQAVVKSMRSWANDHIAFNVTEAFVSLRQNETAQKAFFIFEENNSMYPTPNSSLGEGVSQLKLRRFPEAALPIAEALKAESESAVISALALALAQGDLVQAEKLRSKSQLEKYTQSPTVLDLKEKEEAFDRVSKKFSAHSQFL